MVRKTCWSLAMIAVLAAAGFAFGSEVPPIASTKWRWLDTKLFVEVLPIASAVEDVEEVRFTRTIAAPGGPLLRLRFDRWDLPPGMFVRIVSLATGESADMNNEALDAWSGFTPIFNGDQVLLEIVGHSPQSSAVSLAAVASLEWDSSDSDRSVTPENLCGPDDRVRSNATAVARLWTGTGLCTASLIMTGEHMVSAGHCGPLGAGAFVEFDPPDSTANGTPVAAPPERQFPFVSGSELRDNDWTFAPCDPPNQNQQCITSYGDDALVFEVGANNLGQTAGAGREGYMRIALQTTVPTSTASTKWGCGVTVPETSTANRTLKRLDDVFSSVDNLDGGQYWAYSQDQTGGDSGGPFLRQSLDAAIGVNSSSSVIDCSGGHSYSFNNASFIALIETAVSASMTRFVDNASIVVPGQAAGTIWNPEHVFRNAYDTVPASGRVVVAPGTYLTGNGLLTRPCTILAPMGGVTLSR